MRIIISFFLALFFYSAIIGFFIYFLISQEKQEKPKVVYIHQAIMIKKHIKKSKPKTINKNKTNKPKSKVAKQPSKKPSKQTASKNTLSTGGENIKFNDIFANVSENIKTTKIHHKQKQQLTKQKSVVDEIKKELSKIKTSMNVSNQNGQAKDLDYIQNELAKVWNSILTNDGDFIKIRISIENKHLSFVVIATNLDTIRLNQFKNRLQNIDTTKLNNLNAVIDFKSKLKENE